MDATPGLQVGSVGRVSFIYRSQPVTYATVRADDGKVWMLQNLGSSHVAKSVDDQNAAGDLFQFGRWDDGHAVRSPDNTRSYPLKDAEMDAIRFPLNPAEVAASARPVPFMYGLRSWWPDKRADDQWTAATVAEATATNGVDPCRAIGERWRLPTAADFETLAKAAIITNWSGAFQSAVKLSYARPRDQMNGRIDESTGAYWTSTVDKTGTSIGFNGYKPDRYYRGMGLAIRCMQSGEISGASASGPSAPARSAIQDRPASSIVYHMGGAIGDVRFGKRDTVRFDGASPVPIIATGGYVVISLPEAPTSQRPFYVTWVALDKHGQPTRITSSMARDVTNPPKAIALSDRQWMFSAPESPDGVQWVVTPTAATGGTQRMVVDYNPLR